MAKLTDVLGTEMRGKETQAPVKPGSLFGDILEAGSEGFAAFQKGNAVTAEKEANRAAAARQAEEDRIKASDRGIQNFGAEGVLALGSAEARMEAEAQTTPLNQMDAALNGGEVNTDPGATSPYTAPPLTRADLEGTAQAMARGDEIGQKASSLQSGLKQGRISRAAYELQIEGLLRKGFAMFPDSKYVLLEQMNKYAIEHPIMSEYRAAKSAEEKEISDVTARRGKMADFAVDRGYSPNEYSTDQLVSIGSHLAGSEYRLKQIRDEFDFKIKVKGDQRVDYDRKLKAHDEAVGAWVVSALGPQFSAGVDQFNTYVSDQSIPETERVKYAAEFANTFRPRAYSLIDYTVDEAINKGKMSQEAGDAARTRLRTRVDDIFTQFDSKNPLNVLQVNGAVLKVMKDRLGVDVLEASPMFQSFKEAFGSSEAAQVLVERVANEPELREAFTREMRGFGGLQLGEKTVRVRNLIAFATKGVTLNDFSPAEAANVIADSKKLLDDGMFKLAIRGDSGAQNTVFNTVGKMANAGIQLNPGSSVKQLVNASRYIITKDFLATLKNVKPEHREFAGLVADESRAAAQKLLIALSQKAPSDPYHRIQFNKNAGRFDIVPTGRQVQRRVGDEIERKMGGGIITKHTPPVSNEVKAMQLAMNSNLAFLMNTTNDYEDNTNLKRASHVEKLEFYTTGRLPTSVTKGETPVNGRELMGRLQNFWSNVKVDWSQMPKVDVEDRKEYRSGQARPGSSTVRQLPDGSRAATNLQGKEVVVPPLHKIAEDNATNPVYNKLLETIADNNITGEAVNPILRLAYVEGKFQSHKTPNAFGAVGPMQIVGFNPKTGKEVWDPESEKRFGKKVKDLTTEQNIEFGVSIIRDLIKKYKGNMEQVAAAYHSGSGTPKASSNDGNLYTRDYAKLIGGADEEEEE